MTRAASSIQLAAVAAALLLAASSTSAQERAADLRLVVEPAKAEVALGEPVYVTVTLSNTGSKPVKVLPDLHFESGYANVQIAPAEGRAFTFIPLSVDDVNTASRDLAPGASLTAVNQIFFGGLGWTLRGPGNYGITANFRTPDGTRITSSRVNLLVTEGDGAGRFLFATDRPTQFEAGKFFVWQQGDHLRRALRVLPEIIRKYPNSPVADHARVALAANLSRSFSDASAGGTRPPKPDEALKYLESVNAQNLPRVVRLQQQLSRARSLAALGRKSEAQSAIVNARELTAGQPALLDLLQQSLPDIGAESPQSP